ncbi:MAG: transporter substrate-binding domain-containing protein [Thermoflexales bacterium]|nr:transporter substrate-binding domain-containing protein [Thermoflexales bacterium]
MVTRPRAALALALALLQALTLACSAATSQLGILPESVAATPNAPYAIATATRPPATMSTAGLVRARGALAIGVRFDAPPLASVNAKGELEGLDIDLAREFARRWLGGPDKVSFRQVTSVSALSTLANREIDLAMGGLAASRAGDLQVDYSLPYLTDGDALLTRSGVYTSVVGLARKSVTYVDVETVDALRAWQNSNNFTVTLKSVNSYPAAFDLVRAGGTAAMVGRWRRLRVEAANDPALSVLTVLRREPVTVALPEGDPEWASLVNATLNDVIADGTFARLYQKWFKSAPDAARAPGGSPAMAFSSLSDTLVARNSAAAIAKARKLRVGYISSADPLSFNNKDAASGYLPELLREVAKRWFDSEAAASFVAYPTPDALAAALQAGSIDLGIGNLTVSAANAKRFDFTPTVFQGGFGLLTTAASKATGFGDFNGKTIGVLRDSLDGESLAAAKQARSLTFNEVSFSDMGTALQALRSGQIVAIAGDRLTLFATDRVNRDTKMLGDQLSAVPVAIVVAPGETTLKNALGLALQEMAVDGALQRIYRKWLEEPYKAPLDVLPGEAPSSRTVIAP